MKTRNVVLLGIGLFLLSRYATKAALSGLGASNFRLLDMQAYFEAKTISNEQWLIWLKQFSPLDRMRLKGYRSGLCSGNQDYWVYPDGRTACLRKCSFRGFDPSQGGGFMPTDLRRDPTTGDCHQGIVHPGLMRSSDFFKKFGKFYGL